MKLRTWYFSINQWGFNANRELIAVAVASCRANTDLVPHALYNGQDSGHVAFLEGLGVRVVRHRCSFEDDLRRAYGDKFAQFSGHWLHLDLPTIERQDEFVLYADVDVMFEAPPRVRRAPPRLAAGPEGRPDDLAPPGAQAAMASLLAGLPGAALLRRVGLPLPLPAPRPARPHFNGGVLVMNLPGMRAVHEEFLAAIRARLRGDFRYPTHNQKSWNDFFGPTFTPLPPEMNWKPYWGRNDDARIVHFHGPKPRHFRQHEGGKPMSGEYRTIWNRSPEGYAYYLARYEDYLRQAQAA